VSWRQQSAPSSASSTGSSAERPSVLAMQGPASCRTERSNKRMQLTKLRAAPVWQAEVPPCAPAGRINGGTASQLIRVFDGQPRRHAMYGTRLALLLIPLIAGEPKSPLSFTFRVEDVRPACSEDGVGYPVSVIIHVAVTNLSGRPLILSREFAAAPYYRVAAFARERQSRRVRT